MPAQRDLRDIPVSRHFVEKRWRRCPCLVPLHPCRCHLHEDLGRPGCFLSDYLVVITDWGSAVLTCLSITLEEFGKLPAGEENDIETFHAKKIDQ